jgi:hypothetical protein
MLGMSPKESGHTLDEGDWIFANTGPAAALSDHRAGEFPASERATIAVVGESEGAGPTGRRTPAARDGVPSKTDATRIPKPVKSDPR